MSNFGETLDLDQIEGAEFEFLGPEMRFERNKTKQILKFETKVWSPKSKFWAGQLYQIAKNSSSATVRNFDRRLTTRHEKCPISISGSLFHQKSL